MGATCRVDTEGSGAACDFSSVGTADSARLQNSSSCGKVRVGLYTFGCPRVGNWNFSSLLNRVVPDSFRVGELLYVMVWITLTNPN